jgi:hypothetical protein
MIISNAAFPTDLLNVSQASLSGIHHGLVSNAIKKMFLLFLMVISHALLLVMSSHTNAGDAMSTGKMESLSGSIISIVSKRCRLVNEFTSDIKLSWSNDLKSPWAEKI